MILQHVAKACVEINCEMNCAACQNTPPAPGQTSHMQTGGCLYKHEFRDFGDELTEAVYSVIEPEDLMAVYNIVCQKMDVPYSGSGLMVRAIMAWLPRDVLANTLTEEEELFRKTCVEEDKWGSIKKYEECQNPVIGPQDRPLKYLICTGYSDVNMQSYLQKKLAEKNVGK